MTTQQTLDALSDADQAVLAAHESLSWPDYAICSSSDPRQGLCYYTAYPFLNAAYEGAKAARWATKDVMSLTAVAASYYYAKAAAHFAFVAVPELRK
jgi:hypothetical protein